MPELTNESSDACRVHEAPMNQMSFNPETRESLCTIHVYVCVCLFMVQSEAAQPSTADEI